MPGSNTRVRHKLILELGGKCARCGFTDMRALQLDHINGLGFLEHKTAKPYGKLRYNIDLTKTIFQVLCANCNWIKRSENNEHRFGKARLLEKLPEEQRKIELSNVGLLKGLYYGKPKLCKWRIAILKAKWPN